MQQFVIDKKILSVHTEDRDITKWVSPSLFEVELPVDYKNVVSLRLSDMHMPCSQYVFKTSRQNTTFKLFFDDDKTTVFTITIREGTYSHIQLQNELEGQLNDTADPDLKGFTVAYSFTAMNMTIIHLTKSFTIDFTEPPSPIYNQYTYWGLGYYLGFCKGVYTSNYIGDGNSYVTYTDRIITAADGYFQCYYLTGQFNATVFGEGYIYMELDAYNSMDEIAPFTERSSNLYNSKHTGKHNSAFAKIPVLGVGNEKYYVSKKAFLANMFVSDPPLERIQKLKFKFRYHDGELVDFRNNNFSFTIEVTILRPDAIKPPILINSTNYKLR